MSTAEVRSKVARYWWIGLLGLCLIPFLGQYNCGLEPRAVVGRIPIGSKLSELDLYIGKFYEKSSVEEWVPSRTADSSDKPAKTKLGWLYVRHLGGYDSWTASATERERFTGEITFYHFSAVIPDDLAPSYVVWLVYVRGVLKQKDWGVMPG